MHLSQRAVTQALSVLWNSELASQSRELLELPVGHHPALCTAPLQQLGILTGIRDIWCEESIFYKRDLSLHFKSEGC